MVATDAKTLCRPPLEARPAAWIGPGPPHRTSYGQLPHDGFPKNEEGSRRTGRPEARHGQQAIFPATFSRRERALPGSHPSVLLLPPAAARWYVRGRGMHSTQPATEDNKDRRKSAEQPPTGTARRGDAVLRLFH